MHDLEKVLGVVILNKDGERLLSKYNSSGALKNNSEQNLFERKFRELVKTQNSNSKNGTHIVCFDHLNTVFALNLDLYIIIVADPSENELLLEEFLFTILNCLRIICGKDFSTKSVMKNYCELLLILDEALDKGLILSIVPEEIVSHSQMNDYNFSEKTYASKASIRGLFSMIG